MQKPPDQVSIITDMGFEDFSPDQATRYFSKDDITRHLEEFEDGVVTAKVAKAIYRGHRWIKIVELADGSPSVTNVKIFGPGNSEVIETI